MRTFGLVILGALAASIPFACSNDNPATTSGVDVGGSTGASPPAGVGGGGGSVACGADCAIQCDASALAPSQGDCVDPGGPIECNPITNFPCDLTSNEACDVAPGGFRCFQEPNNGQLCEPCSPSGEAHCAAGLTCTAEGVCAKFCCNDGDCGNGGKCDLIDNLGLGICLKGSGGPGSGGGGPGGGGPGSGGSGPGSGGGGPGGGGPGGGGPGGMGGLGGMGGVGGVPGVGGAGGA